MSFLPSFLTYTPVKRFQGLRPFQGFRVSEFQGFGTTVEPWNCGTVKQPFQSLRVSEFQGFGTTVELWNCCFRVPRLRRFKSLRV